MTDWLHLLYIFAGIWIGGIVLHWIVVVVTVRRLRFRQPIAEQIDCEQIPELHWKLLAPYQAQIEALGFQPDHCRTWAEPSTNLPHAPAMVFLHSDHCTYLLGARGEAHGTDPRPRWILLTFLQDGRLCMTDTLERSQITEDEVWLARVARGSLPELLESHLAWARQSAGDEAFQRLGAAEITQRLQILQQTSFEAALKEGHLIPADADTFKLSWRQVLPNARIIAQSLRNHDSAVAADAEIPPAQLTVEERAELDYDLYEVAGRMRQGGKQGWIGKLFWLAVTLFLFCLAFGFQFSPDFLVVLLVVLTIHELGHVLGMALCGYRDLSMLYLPFLGAVAIGKTDRPTPWKELLVLFMGPMPGLFASIGILLWIPEPPGWLYEGALFALILNGFNLLPFTPLDGGQIWDILLFRRFPRLQMAFQLLSALALFAVGAFLLQSIALGIAGGFLFFQALQGFGRVEVMKGAERRLGGKPRWEVDEPDFARAALAWMLEKKTGYEKLLNRLGKAIQVVVHRPLRPATWPVILLGLLVYTSPLLLLGVYFVQQTLGHTPGTVAEVDPADYAPPAIDPARNAAPILLPLIERIEQADYELWLEPGARQREYVEVKREDRSPELREWIGGLREAATTRSQWFTALDMQEIPAETAWNTALHLLMREAETGDETARLDALQLCRLLSSSPHVPEQQIGRNGYRLILGRLLELIENGRPSSDAHLAAVREQLPYDPEFRRTIWRSRAYHLASTLQQMEKHQAEMPWWTLLMPGLDTVRAWKAMLIIIEDRIDNAAWPTFPPPDLENARNLTELSLATADEELNLFFGQMAVADAALVLQLGLDPAEIRSGWRPLIEIHRGSPTEVELHPELPVWPDIPAIRESETRSLYAAPFIQRHPEG